MSWKSECRYMPAGIRVGFEINGRILSDDANPSVLRMRRTVRLRERWLRQEILKKTLAIGKFGGSADLTQGVAIINGRENYYWTLTLRPDRTQLKRLQEKAQAAFRKSIQSRRRGAA